MMVQYQSHMVNGDARDPPHTRAPFPPAGMTNAMNYHEALGVALFGWSMLACFRIFVYLFEQASSKGAPSSFAPSDIPHTARLVAPGTPIFLLSWCLVSMAEASVRTVVTSCPYHSDWWSRSGDSADPSGSRVDFTVVTYIFYVLFSVIDNVLLMWWARCIFRDGNADRAWRVILACLFFYLLSAVGWGGTGCVDNLDHAGGGYALIIVYYVLHTMWILGLVFLTGCIYATSSGLVVNLTRGYESVDYL
jgi:hypothetical protein